ncbi:MAG: N-acetyltransferase [Pyrinomonadaceae bacterium]|nr:N-acetyltransferase [Pyrinomonadaceae bacterium]MBP6211649.1 N-acetyltransferase [Pyrinomonadaceae bacterium]
MEIRHVDNGKKGAFVIDVDGEQMGEIEYFVSAPGVITIFHTGVNEKLRGQRAGDKLVAAAIEYARSNGLKVITTCTFAKKVIDRTPEFQDVLAEQ